MRRSLALMLLLPVLASAQEPTAETQPAPKPEPKPEPGRVSVGDVEVGTIRIRPRTGTVDDALKCWIEAHRVHQEEQVSKALVGYLAFLGMPGHRALPGRYAEIARRRIEAIHAPVREQYEQSCKVYLTDRRKALATWRMLAERWGNLPEGAAALRLWHSDELRGAIDQARALKADGKQEQAAASLEKAVRANTGAIYLYEARTLLVDLGGPDLRPRVKRSDPDDDTDDEPDPEDDGESEIEIND